jgi:hypothetical protein
MLKIFAKSILSFMAVMLLLFLINMKCSARSLEQNSQNIPEQRQRAVSSAKPKETSIFTVIELEDLEYPTLAASIQLPFHVRPNNTVILSGKHVYLTTEQHLHVVDVSIPQRPSYLTSLAFPAKIGKVLAFGDYLVVASRKKFHLVDISQPSHPVLQFTMYLPQRNAIKDFDVLDTYLYIIGANDYLYVFSLVFGQARLVKSIELEKRWWLLSPEAGSPKVKQIPLSTSHPISEDLLNPPLSQRGFLQLSSRGEKVRASSEILGVESLKDPMYDLFTFDAHIVNDHRSSHGKGYYNVEREYRDYLSAMGVKTLTRRNPKIVYTFVAGKMQQIDQDPSTEKIDVANKRLLGPVTDFQISGGLLYVVNAKGFFSIKRLIKFNLKTLHRVGELREKWFVISATPLQPNRPISLAVAEGYAFVLATPEK